MLGKIVEIVSDRVKLKLDIDIKIQPSLSSLHVVFDDDGKKIIGEIDSIFEDYMYILIIGEIIDNRYFPGVTRKPSFKSSVRIISLDELSLIFGSSTPSINTFFLGESSIYNNYGINVPKNNFFSNHFAIIGNSGSGKSCGTATVIQNLFYSDNPPLKANLFVFDAFGEYHNAFRGLNQINPNICYKSITTNSNDPEGEQLRIPLWLLGSEGISMLLDVNDEKQIPIIDKALNLLPILSRDDDSVLAYKNNIIARCLKDIILTGKSAAAIRNQVISILTYYNTKDLNLNLKIVEPGYIRTLNQCLYVDGNDSMQAIEKVVEAVSQFITDDLDLVNQPPVAFSLEDFNKALSFALISEGILKSDKVYDYANILSVRCNALLEGEYAKFFDVRQYMSEEEYINRLMISRDGRKAQMINFNINEVDDRFAKVLVKIISKIIFNINVKDKNRASRAFHIIVEEAHRYIQNDIDTKLFGYNIFDRIAKEGRKYGVLLGVITQRPSEISETTISQCSNFLIFRTMHAKDLAYLETMIPSANEDTMQMIKTLQPGTCMTFGSAFKMPISVKLHMPNPAPLSNNAQIDKIWY